MCVCFSIRTIMERFPILLLVLRKRSSILLSFFPLPLVKEIFCQAPNSCSPSPTSIRLLSPLEANLLFIICRKHATKKLDKQQSWLWCLGSFNHLSLHHSEVKLRQQPIPVVSLKALNNGGSATDSRLEPAAENRSWKKKRFEGRQEVPFTGHSIFWTKLCK